MEEVHLVIKRLAKKALDRLHFGRADNILCPLEGMILTWIGRKLDPRARELLELQLAGCRLQTGMPRSGEYRNELLL